MTENFPLSVAERKMSRKIDLKAVTAEVEKGTKIELDYLLNELEAVLFKFDPLDPAKFSLNVDAVRNDKERGEAVQIINKIQEKIEALEKEYIRARYSKKPLTGVDSSITKDEFENDINILVGLVQTYIDQIESFLSYEEGGLLGTKASLERDKDPGSMTLEELTKYLERTLNWKEVRAQRINEEFLHKIDLEKDEHKVSWHRTRRALAAILGGDGDTGLVSFDVWFNNIVYQLADKTLPYTRLVRALFLKKPEKNGDITPEDLNNAEINERALEVYEYIVKRIKHKPSFGGLDRDPEDPNNKEDFSYLRLKGDNVAAFKKHLKEKFPDLDHEEEDGGNLLDILIKYAQATAAKSAGFIPWLLHETTRQHGLTLASLSKREFQDELFVSAPFAAGWYSRNRYGQNIPNATSEEMLFLPEKLLEHLAVDEDDMEKKEKIAANENLPSDERERANKAIKEYKEKVREAKELWKIVNLFRETLWNGIPKWVNDVRKMMVIGQYRYGPDGKPFPHLILHDGTFVTREVGPNEIDLNSSIFPLPGEVAINVMRVEQEKHRIENKEKPIIKFENEQIKLIDLFRERAEEIMNLETRISDIEEEISLLDPTVDAVRMADLNNEKNSLEPQTAELNRIIGLINTQIVDLGNRIKILRQEWEDEKRRFVGIFSRQGYGDTFEQIGRAKLNDVKPDDYQPLAFEALKNMYEAFRTAPKVMSRDEIIKDYLKWQDKWVGKAKLTPGKHHLLFGPFTVRFIYRLLNQYEYNGDRHKVNELREEIIKHLRGARGLPWYTREYVDGYLGKKPVGALVRYERGYSEGIYLGELYRFQNDHLSGWRRRLRGALPLTWGKRSEQGGPMEMEAPWMWDQVDLHTGEGGSEGAK